MTVAALNRTMSIHGRLARQLGALFAAIAGLMDIVSALYPAIHSRVEVLHDLLPSYVIRGSQTATVLVGFGLILLADGLRKRRTRALHITIALLLVSAVLNLTKGLDFEEASVAMVLAVVLLASRQAFDLPCRPPVPRNVLQRAGTVALLYYCYLLAGFLILRRFIDPTPSVRGVTVEPFRLLMDAPYYHYLTAQARWFERSLAFLGCMVALYFVVQVLRPLAPARHATMSEIERARALIRRWGVDTLSYFALQDGRSYFFDLTGEAFLSYRLWGNVALVGGDPIGAPGRLPHVVQAFLDFAEANGIEPCFLGVGPDYVHLYHSAGLRTLKIGEEAIISLSDFDVSALKRKVRRAVRHVAELGIECIIYRRDQAPESVMTQIHEISQEWVESKGGGERGFSMTLGRLPRLTDHDCEIVVAQQGARVYGYLCMAPVYRGESWSLDAMRRRPDSPNGLTEFLVIHAAQAYRDRGYERLSLNFAALANSADDIDSRGVEETRRFLFEHLSSVYQLKSLYQFNSKFEPLWRSRYLAYRDVLKIPKLAVAIAQSEDPIRLPSLAGVFKR